MNEVGTRFLNVDLDLKSKSDLSPLLAKLAKKVIVLHSRKDRAGRHHASLELSEQRYDKADTCIARFVQLIQALPTSARRIWDGASVRHFNVGIEAGAASPTFSALIKGSTLRQVADVGGEIVITVYPPHISEPEGLRMTLTAGARIGHHHS